jgi:hypothetical protein
MNRTEKRRVSKAKRRGKELSDIRVLARYNYLTGFPVRWRYENFNNLEKSINLVFEDQNAWELPDTGLILDL